MIILAEEWIDDVLRRVDRRVAETVASRIGVRPERDVISSSLKSLFKEKAADKLGQLLIEHEPLHEKSVREALGYFRSPREVMKTVAQLLKASNYRVYREIQLEGLLIDLYAYKEVVTSFGSLVPTGGSISETIIIHIASSPPAIWEGINHLRRLRGYADKSMITTSPYAALSARDTDRLLRDLEESGIGLMILHQKKTGKIVTEPETQPRDPARYENLLQVAQAHKRI